MGQRLGEKRVARLMHAGGIHAKYKRQFKVTTDSKPSHPVAPHLTGRGFESGASDPNGSRTAPTSPLVKAGCN
jgi:transposase InsO family protein